MEPITSRAVVVGIWRRLWLGRSETFIQNQIESLTQWKSIHIAWRRKPDGLSIPLHFMLPPVRRWWRVLFHRWVGGHSQRQFRDLVRRRNVRLIHAHFGTDAWDILPYVRSARIPLVVTFHGHDVTRHVGGGDPKTRQRRKKLRAVFKTATLLVAVSSYIADQLRKLGAPEAKIRIHRIGIPHGEFPEFDTDRKGVCFVGRFVEKKGIFDLLEAYAKLPKPLQNRHPLRLVGTGGLEAKLKERATDLGIEPEWLGWRSSDEVRIIMQSSAVFCGPSKIGANGDAEGLGMVFLEAQSRGTPVVAYRHGGVPEAIDEGTTGLLADEGDIAGLARALESVLASPVTCRQMGEAGARWVRENYDIVKQTRLLEDLYREVARVQV